MDVGVILPCRGPAPWLAEALGSVLTQHPVPAAVVVVDDGSEVPLALPGVPATPVRLVRHERSLGPARARATGFEHLDTALIALCDADDAWLPGKLAAQAPLIDAGADVCFGPVEIVGPAGRATGERWPCPAPQELDARAWRSVLFALSPIATPTVVLRREALERAGGFAGGPEVRRAEDLDLWLRLETAGARFAATGEPLARVRRREGALTADVAALAADSLLVREHHSALVDADVRRRTRARDLRALARGRIRERRWSDARREFAAAAALERPAPRERAVAAAAAVPGLRAALGRRDPYRR